MSAHDYIPEQALDVLLRKVKERDELLEATIRQAIDVGNEVIEVNHRGSRRIRNYRTVQFTHEEALQVAIQVLRSCFVELPLCINSSIENFRSAAVGPSAANWTPWHQEANKSALEEDAGAEKRLEIELQTLTQIFKTPQETLPLKKSDQQEINSQADLLNRLAVLVEFGEE